MERSNLGFTEIMVQEFSGKAINLLEKYKGASLLLLFYNNQCLGCTGRAIPLAYEFSLEFTELQVIGIHSNFSEGNIREKEIRSIFTSSDLPFPIYVDKNHELYDFFNAEGTPHWILVEKSGKVFRSIFGSQSNSKNRLFYALESLVS